MSEHLTQQQLIDYEFKLASDTAMDKARTHLAQCQACRERLGGLIRKFAALDLLRDEIKASDDLVSRTVQSTAGPSRKRAVLWVRFPWLGAVAAAFIVGFALLLVSNLDQDREPVPQAGYGPVVLEDTPRGKIGPEDARGGPERPGVTYGETSELGGVRGSLVADAPTSEAVALAPVAEIEEKAPFAPASAIELVVLPRREDVQLTIYNAADLTLVRERRNLTLKRGWNWLQFMWANTLIDPTSLSLESLEHKDQVEIQQLVFPPRLRELGRWLIRSEVGGQVPFELTYFTSGLAWRAFYMGTLSPDEKTMHLEAYVRVSNHSGEDYENARTRLIVGQVHLLDQIAALARQQYAYGQPEGTQGQFQDGYRRDLRKVPVLGDMPIVGQVLRDGDMERKEIRKEGLSEYFLYTIEGTETIPNEWGKRLLSLEADDVPVTGLYKYDEQRWGAQTIRFLSFANDEEHKLGDTPLPDGTVRIYGRTDEQGHLSYVGGTEVKYIPVGEEVELNLGPARLVEVKLVLMDMRTENYAFDRDRNISGWDEVRTWRVEVANARTLPVDVEVTRGFETPYWTLKPPGAEATYEKYDATHARFQLTAGPRRKHMFDYTVTTFHGVRQETLSNAESRRPN